MEFTVVSALSVSTDDPNFSRNKIHYNTMYFDRTAKIHVKGMLQARCRPRTGCKQLQEVVKITKILKYGEYSGNAENAQSSNKVR